MSDAELTEAGANEAAVVAAAARLSGVVRRTPLAPAEALSRETGAAVYLKLENLQETGSFKLRGAYNHIASTTGEARIIAASAGNHAQG
ncbi:MAG TPA: pyridoxal-phosphate dependent enzyme, partial [Trueperaceae bacterium]|nr:pyridoxal-phosphate dependent enzyme [Trueperaceae bacterium]